MNEKEVVRASATSVFVNPLFMQPVSVTGFCNRFLFEGEFEVSALRAGYQGISVPVDESGGAEMILFATIIFL